MNQEVNYNPQGNHLENNEKYVCMIKETRGSKWYPGKYYGDGRIEEEYKAYGGQIVKWQKQVLHSR